MNQSVQSHKSAKVIPKYKKFDAQNYSNLYKNSTKFLKIVLKFHKITQNCTKIQQNYLKLYKDLQILPTLAAL